jgi:AraC-like DNA-binding protein
MKRNQVISTAISVFKNKAFDGFELKNAVFLNKEFPSHFHTNWSIALIKTGSENLFIYDKKLLITANTLVIIPPYLPHSHGGQQDAFWSYQALYFEDDVISKVEIPPSRNNRDLVPQQYFDQIKHKIILSTNPQFIFLFHSFCNALKENSFKKITFTHFINAIFSDKKTSMIEVETSKLELDFIEEIKLDIAENLTSKITLDALSHKFHVEKFNLMRQFKKSTGLTPNDYLTTLRIEASKKLMYEDAALMDIAYSTGFYDQSHFYHSFKKYVGLSPTNYRQSLQYFTSQHKI